MENQQLFFKLRGKVQHYQWGGYDFIPQLLGEKNDGNKNFAEYWLGAHDNAPSEIEGKGALNKFIAQHPGALGKQVQQQFGKLPYLFKVLDVKDMLSIQVHPSKKAAEIDFARENAAGIALNASNRNYKDDNHKPELMVALSDFWLLHGFKTASGIKEAIGAIPEFAFMKELFADDNYQQLYKTLMEMPQEKINWVLQPLIGRIVPLYKSNSLQKSSADFWAARAAITFNEGDNMDKGIFSVYLLNLVNLKPGEAIFQDAGILHAYLEGQNMEIMANSDNVLRGGLTPKHIDVAELIKHVRFVPVIPEVIHAKKEGKEEVFKSPAPDFELSRFMLKKDEQAQVNAHTTDILLVMEGSMTANGLVNKTTLRKGEAGVALAGASITITALESLVLYRASVPGEKA